MKKLFKCIFIGTPVFIKSIVGLGIISIILIYFVGMNVYGFSWRWGFPIIAAAMIFSFITIFILGRTITNNN